VRDAVAHGARAQNCDGLDVHMSASMSGKTEKCSRWGEAKRECDQWIEVNR
jgi:hypothetical protein